MNKKVALAAASQQEQTFVGGLAREMELDVVTLETPGADLLLVKTAERLELRQTGKGAPGPVYADFVSGKAAHRRRFGGGRGTPLAKAVGLKGGKTPYVLDATAGLGKDAFVLSTLGCKVLMVERSAVIAALLQDALRRAERDSETATLVQRMQLVLADARTYLTSLLPTDFPDVVYLDPMYPHGKKSALVKKDMQLFQLLLGKDQDSAELLALARKTALQRVVVKRAAKAPCLGDQTPDTVIKSPNTRYDIYLRANPSA